MKSWIEDDQNTQDEIVKELKKSGFNVTDFRIDAKEYRHYLKLARYENYSGYYGGGKGNNFAEKSLEHFIAAKLLDLSKEDIYIDVASADAPTSDIYHRLFGCSSYQQDLIFPEGINGNVIGGDASDMPVKDGFATKIGLHCSFEHFEQDSDMRFIRETKRVLRKGGRLCIIPLYLFNKYAVHTDLSVFLPWKGVNFEPDATVYCAKGYENRHGRFYDVPHLITRVRNNLDGLKLTVYVVQNAKDIDPSCYVRFVALLEKSAP